MSGHVEDSETARNQVVTMLESIFQIFLVFFNSTTVYE